MYDFIIVKVSTGAKIRSRYNQVPHPTQLSLINKPGSQD